MATYNALKYTQRLEDAGFTREQAQETVKTVIETVDDNFATKFDLKEMEYALRGDIQSVRTELYVVRAELKQDIQALRTELKQDIQDLRTELYAVRAELKQDIQDLRHDMKQMESRLTIKMGAMMMAGIAILQFLK